MVNSRVSATSGFTQPFRSCRPTEVGPTGQSQASARCHKAGSVSPGSESSWETLRGAELDLGGQGLSRSHLRRVHAGVSLFIMMSVIVKSILCVLLGITTIILV